MLEMAEFAFAYNKVYDDVSVKSKFCYFIDVYHCLYLCKRIANDTIAVYLMNKYYEKNEFILIIS